MPNLLWYFITFNRCKQCATVRCVYYLFKALVYFWKAQSLLEIAFHKKWLASRSLTSTIPIWRKFLERFFYYFYYFYPIKFQIELKNYLRLQQTCRGVKDFCWNNRNITIPSDDSFFIILGKREPLFTLIPSTGFLTQEVSSEDLAAACLRTFYLPSRSIFIFIFKNGDSRRC